MFYLLPVAYIIAGTCLLPQDNKHLRKTPGLKAE
jgi:hypothetical protein